MNASGLDDLLGFLVDPSKAMISEFTESQRVSSRFPDELRKKTALLRGAIEEIDKTDMHHGELDAFIEFEPHLSTFANTIVKGVRIDRLRDSLKQNGLTFLTELGIANKFISSKPNFMTLERLFS